MFVKYENLTNEQARQWLVANDQEAAQFWAKEGLSGADLRPAVADNLREWGHDNQDGPLLIG